MGYNKYGLISNYTKCQRTGLQFLWFNLYQFKQGKNNGLERTGQKGLNYRPLFLMTYKVEVSTKGARAGRVRWNEHTGPPQVVIRKTFTTSCYLFLYLLLLFLLPLISVYRIKYYQRLHGIIFKFALDRIYWLLNKLFT